MTNQPGANFLRQDSRGQSISPGDPVSTWLMAADPSLRWQVRQDLLGEPADCVAGERARIESEGWGRDLLARQRPDGAWGDSSDERRWETTLYTMQLLRQMGLDPTGIQVQAMLGRLIDGFTWGPEFGDTGFFEGEEEPCINGTVLALGGYFGLPNESLLRRLLSEQLPDGGWNCRAACGSVRSSFHTTICVLDGLLEYEMAVGVSDSITAAQARGQSYLLERRLWRRLSDGAVIDAAWERSLFPLTWHYDVLRGLDYLRRASVVPDERVSEAMTLLASQRQPDGCWPVERQPSDPCLPEFLIQEPETGQPSRWNTLRTLRVLRWFG